MTKAQVGKLVVWLIAGIIYVHLSGFMAHYYNETDLKKSPTTVNKLLLEPLEVVNKFLNESSTPPTSPLKPEDPVLKFLNKTSFHVYFFAWPVFFLIALIYWMVLVIFVIILVGTTLLSLLLSLILWMITYIILGFNIF